MKRVKIEDLKVSMMTAEAVFDKSGYTELLKIGTKLTLRQIQLLENLGIETLPIIEESDPEYLIYSKENATDTKIKTDGLNTDLINDLNEIKDEEEYFKATESIYNRNMEIHILTGEANTPIDVKYEKELMDVKTIFNNVMDTGELEVQNIRENVTKMLPSMINNNDVMMRLRQLKETDDYLFDHSFRVSIMAANVAKWLKYPQADIENITMASLLYEIGNLKLPPEIFKKKEPLNQEEKALIKKHPQLAYHVLMKTKGIHQDIKFVALQHHERLDGSGYPLRIKSAQIHAYSKIVMVCDIFDAMTQDRPYRKKISPFDAAEYILWESGKSLDMRVCYFFLKNLAEFYTGKTCILNTGQEAKIILVDVNYPTRPLIKIGDKFVDLSKDTQYKIVDFI